MKIAVLGGSFNPLHNGHIFLAEAVLKEFDYENQGFRGLDKYIKKKKMKVR